jgi:hypothetical protein
MRALLGCESALDGTVKVLGLVESSDLAQARALSLNALLDVGVIFNLDEIRRHGFLRLWTARCSPVCDMVI